MFLSHFYSFKVDRSSLIFALWHVLFAMAVSLSRLDDRDSTVVQLQGAEFVVVWLWKCFFPPFLLPTDVHHMWIKRVILHIELSKKLKLEFLNNFDQSGMWLSDDFSVNIQYNEEVGYRLHSRVTSQMKWINLWPDLLVNHFQSFPSNEKVDTAVRYCQNSLQMYPLFFDHITFCRAHCYLVKNFIDI